MCIPFSVGTWSQPCSGCTCTYNDIVLTCCHGIAPTEMFAVLYGLKKASQTQACECLVVQDRQNVN